MIAAEVSFQLVVCLQNNELVLRSAWWVMTPAAALVMLVGQREALQVLSRSQTTPYRQVQRAKALLLAADGVANTSIAAQVGVKPPTVRGWRSWFAQEGLAKLGKVRAGRGRKSTIPQGVSPLGWWGFRS
jgi:winged helix-turn helix protein